MNPLPGGPSPARTAASPEFQRAMTVAMERMMRAMHMTPPAGDADIDFLAMMIPHHAGAVEMARALLEHGRDPATRSLAEEIIASQTTEIDGMTRRLASLKGHGVDEPSFPALGGTRGP